MLEYTRCNFLLLLVQSTATGDNNIKHASKLKKIIIIIDKNKKGQTTQYMSLFSSLWLSFALLKYSLNFDAIQK